MRVDLRVKHDVETRRHAAELFDSGAGCWGASRAFPSPRGTVRQWQRVYRAFGSEVLLKICPDSSDAFYAAFGRPSSAGQLASLIPFKLSSTHVKHRNFDNEPHIHISCGKKKDEKSLFPVKTNAQPCSTSLKHPG